MRSLAMPLGHQLFPEMVVERHHNEGQVASHHTVELVECEVDSVVCDAVLRVVVRANPL